MVLDDFAADYRPVVQLVEAWFTNRKPGILQYMASDRFNPLASLDPALVKALYQQQTNSRK